MPCPRGCCASYRDHLLSVSVAPSATPSRHPQAVEVNEREARWHKDMPAYKRLVDSGVQPPRIDGCADIEARAETKLEVERATVLTDRQRRQVESLRSEGVGV